MQVIIFEGDVNEYLLIHTTTMPEVVKVKGIDLSFIAGIDTIEGNGLVIDLGIN